MGRMSIGQLARQGQVGVETIRFYERKGLLPAPPRRSSGYRQFPEDALRRLRFIKRAQTVGFTLKEVSELLSLRVAPGTSCADIKRRAEDKIVETEQKIRSLQKMRTALIRLKEDCRGRGPTSECPILETLDR